MAPPLPGLSPRVQARPTGVHHLMEHPKALAGVHRLPRARVVSSLVVLLSFVLVAAFFASRHLHFAIRASLPAPADVHSSILPRLFARHAFGRVPAPAPAPDPAPKSAVGSADGGSVSLLDGGEVSACDIFDGEWVSNDRVPWYRPGSCPFAEEAFDCAGNGRPDFGYMKFRWKPRRCNLPRMDGKGFLEMLKGKRLVFVGDSLNRNMWESLACILRESATNKSQVFEISGRQDFRTEGFYSIKYADYNCTVEFMQTPFLVQEWEAVSYATGGRKETLRVDLMHDLSTKYRDADILVFNTGHWWTHPRTSEGKDFYQEGEHVYSQLSAEDAYSKALRTWAKWVDANVDPNRTVVFFRGYSSSHYSGGQWNSGGNCDGEMLPITDDAHLEDYPEIMNIFETVLEGMKTPVHYLNITKMAGYRKDAHPSAFRMRGKGLPPDEAQDCSHWCLPGVPDYWNELLYAMLLRDAYPLRQSG
ncbi:hypothetical protein Taro_017986 [Colocasia esculenta]|uniref:Trichome birefringence-like N-terminal domain-containing protein n=1 Tax=Colocasia esculenta TaxID=4460 RepID=A0A843USS0_COLES|nr:hypothetical protein [Colocasia esculenta]